MSDIVELNVGGKIFATTTQTLMRDNSQLANLIHTSQRRDKENRIFIDRDPTYFRWILNYLRDGLLLTLPATQQERTELLVEARYFGVVTLAVVLENSLSTQPPHPPQHQLPPQPDGREIPTFQTARPSTKGIFFFQNAKWQNLYSIPVSDLDLIGVQFEEGGKDEIKLLSLTIDRNQNLLTQHKDVDTIKLVIDKTAKAITALVPNEPSEFSFWWEPSTTQYPQLFAKISRGETALVPSQGLDFIKTSNGE
eukprot:TRINITY_DN4987_c0_g1_i2.p1 TRINITY_DN4987_c0_g1~~TRINITY_DN4987_c0_g1_i2.p1  ORF type:complete len:265 (+),score=47.16 TRINITY_DN4987_c0_g1_i2:42-797(+)